VTAFKTLVIALTGALVSNAAAGDVLPGYDPEAYCEKIVGLSGSNSEVMHSSCMDMELEAYDSLRERWADLTISIREYCDKIAAISGEGSYATLKTCVEMELGASRSDKARASKF